MDLIFEKPKATTMEVSSPPEVREGARPLLSRQLLAWYLILLTTHLWNGQLQA